MSTVGRGRRIRLSASCRTMRESHVARVDSPRKSARLANARMYASCTTSSASLSSCTTARAIALAPVIAEIQASGTTAPHAIAAALTLSDIPAGTARGGPYRSLSRSREDTCISTEPYGPLCTVVWEGEAARPTPIPIAGRAVAHASSMAVGSSGIGLVEQRTSEVGKATLRPTVRLWHHPRNRTTPHSVPSRPGRRNTPPFRRYATAGKRRPVIPSISRSARALSGFLTLIQSRDGPDR
jgi:hypothetical protein